MGVNLTGVSNTPIPVNFNLRGWTKLFAAPAPLPTNIDIFREFYTYIREDNEHQQTYVQGVLFEFSIDLIATILHLSWVVHDAYHFRPDSVIPTMLVVASVL